MDPSSESNILIQLILIVVLTATNAFFAAAEMAIVSLNKTKIKSLAQSGNKKAMLLKKLMDEPSKLLATIQVGITLAGFLSSASAATGIASKLSYYLKDFNIPYTEQISIVVITILLSYITLVFGELFPKRIALQKSETIAMIAVKPILFVSKFTSPFVKLLSASTNFLVKIFGLNSAPSEEEVSIEEIKSLVKAGEETGIINPTEKDMITSIFEFDDTLAKEVMTPKPKVCLVDIDEPTDNYLDKLLEEKYSRIPVYKDSIDNIVGILYLKDLFIHAKQHGFDNLKIDNILHPPYFVPENKNIQDLFLELQSSKNHMAILIDEYGAFTGIVTLEDLIEEIMGEIDDEYDDVIEPKYTKINDNSYIVSGLLTLEELNEEFNLKLESEDCDTIGGYLIDKIGRIPSINEEINIPIDDVTFKVAEIEDKRISKILLEK